MKLTDRLWIAVCLVDGSRPCFEPCQSCLSAGKAAGLAVAEWLEDRCGGYSETAQLLRGVCEE